MNAPSLTPVRVLSLSLILALVGFALVGPDPAAAQGRPQFGTRVEVLQIQVRVADSGGAFVSGLGASDFKLKVNGKDRSLTTVYEVDLNESNALPGSSIADAPPPPPAAWRQFLLFFDAGFNSPRGVREAQQAAVTFLQEQVQPSDLVGVATYNVVSGTRLLVPFTSDRRQVMDAVGGLGLRTAAGKIDRAGLMAETMREAFLGDRTAFDVATAADPSNSDADAAPFADAIEEYINAVDRMDDDQYASVAAQYSEQLGILGKMLTSVRGTKHVVLFSKGFADEVISGASLDEMAAMSAAMDANAAEAIANDRDSRFGNSEVRAALDSSLATLRAAGAVIHVVDPSGVGGERDSGLASGGRGGGTFSSAGATRGALSMLADGTDGTISWNTNQPATALASIEESTRQFYVLAFPRDRNDRDRLDLDVEVTRSGVELLSAPRSLAPPPAYTAMDDMQKQAQLAEFIAKGIIESDMQFEMAAAAFSGSGSTHRVGVVLEVPWGQLEELAKARDDGKLAFDIFSYVLDETGAVADLSNNQINLDFNTLNKGRTKGLPFRFYDLLWSRSGNKQVRSLIRESKIGRISAATQDLAVPRTPGGPLTVTGPVAMDEEHHGMLMRPQNFPEHKAGGPLDFPYVFKDIEYTPATHAEATPGSTQQVFVAIHNLSRHPLTGQAQPPTISLHLFNGVGEEIKLADIQLIDQAPDPAGGIQMVLGAVLPENLPTGFYRLRFKAVDSISATTIEQDAELWVIDD